MHKTRYHHGDLRHALIDAARARISKQGVDGWSMKAASEDLGVTHAAAYKHFRNKAALVTAVCDGVMLEFAQALRAAIGSTPEESYFAMGITVVRFARSHPTLYALTFGSARADDRVSLATAGEETAFHVLRSEVVAWQESGWLGPGDPVSIALMLWSATHGLAMLVSTGRFQADDVESEAMARSIMQAMHQGLQ